MNTAAALADHDLSPEAVAILREGAENALGYCCTPGQVVKNFPAISEAEKRGYIVFLGERPWITPEGRAAIGGPTESEAGRARLVAACTFARKPLQPAKRNDPRTDFDYRSYKAMRLVCTLVVRQPDHRENPPSVRVGRSLTSPPQFLGARNSNIQPESTEKFIVTLVPEWMTRPMTKDGQWIAPIFSSYQFAIDETKWSAEDCATWDRLRQVCYSINSRIRSAGRRQSERMRFGENA